MIGLCTEADPTLLGRKPYQNGFAQFMRLSSQGGVLRPVPSDGTHASPTFAETQLGTSIVSESFVIDSVAGFTAYVAQAGGTTLLRAPSGSTYAIALPSGPTLSCWTYQYTAGSNGLPYGSTALYVAAWSNPYTHGGLGSVATASNDIQTVTFASGSGVAPVRGGTFTDGTYTGTLCDMLLSGTNWAAGSAAGLFAFRPAGTLASGATLTFASASAVTAATSATAPYAQPVFTQSGTLPSGATDWFLYRLDDTGVYGKVGTGVGTFAGTVSQVDTSYHADALLTDGVTRITPYDGPLDTNGLPETLVVPGTAQTLCLHKGCLFLGEGSLLRWSEGMLAGQEVGWFREGFTLDAGGTVWALVSRGEILEVYTASGIKYVIGSPPYFEIRDSQINEKPVSRFSIVPTDRGTIYHGADGLRMLVGGGSKLLSNGWNRPWFDAIAAPGSTVAGASLGRYVLSDATGRAIVWDWEAEEWSERTFSACPSGFLWSSTGRYLVAKVAAAYLAFEQGTSAVSWAVQYPTRGGARSLPLPSYVWIDNTGSLTVDVYVDGALYQSLPVASDFRGKIRLPSTRGLSWYLVLRGTGTPSTNIIRSLA